MTRQLCLLLRIYFLIFHWIIRHHSQEVLCQSVTMFPSPRANVYLDGSLNLTCTSSGNVRPTSTTFWRNKTTSVGTIFQAFDPCNVFGDLLNTSSYTVNCLGNNQVTVTIKKVRLVQHGEKWHCSQAIYGEERESANTSIYVKVRVVSVTLITSSSSSVIVPENSSIDFICTTSRSRPAPIVSWYIDGNTAATNDDVLISQVVTQSPAAGSDGYVATTGSLTYKPSRDANGKYVFCKARDGYGYTVLSNRKIQLNITYKPDSGPLIQSYTNTTVYYAIDNKQQTLTCTVTGGNPLASLSWSCFTGTEQDLSSAQTVSKRWQWRTSSSGTCTCTSTHLGVHENLVLNVRVLSPPTSPVFLLHSQTVQGSTTVKIIRDSTAPITCSATSTPSPDRYTWTYDGQSTALSQVASLYPSQITADGRYWCQVGNTMRPSQGQVENGSSSAYINIQRLYAPSVVPFNVEPIVEGTTLSVECKTVSGNPANTTYSWKRKLSSSSDTTWRHIPGATENGGRLVKTNINRNDAGTYRCTASNVMKPTAEQQQIGSDSKNFILNVLYEASITAFFIEGHRGQTNVTVDENDGGIRFTCEVDSNPTSTVKIMFNGEVLKEGSNTKQISFIHSSATCLDGGEYTCEGNNQYGHSSKKSIKLFVKCSPRSLYEMRQNITSALHVPVTLSFTTLAYPSPGTKGFAWFRENGGRWTRVLSNADLRISSSELQSNLTILNVSNANYGRYRLTVRNHLGNYSQYLFLEEDVLTEEGLSETSARYSGMDSDNTAVIIGISLGLVVAALAIYSTSITILYKRKTTSKDSQPVVKESTQKTYVNVAYNQNQNNDSAPEAEVDDARQYTDLVGYSRDDRTTYEVLHDL